MNTRYGDAPSLVERFSLAGVRAHVSELSSVSVCVEDKGSAAALPGFAAGEFFVQDAAAAMSVLCAAPKKGCACWMLAPRPAERAFSARR